MAWTMGVSRTQKIRPVAKLLLGSDAAGVVRVDYKQADPLAVFRSWVEFGLSNATAIAEAMDVSVGHVSKLAKRAVGAGWLKVQGRKYILVSGVPV
jgi:CRP-like cAMP-binding protein